MRILVLLWLTWALPLVRCDTESFREAVVEGDLKVVEEYLAQGGDPNIGGGGQNDPGETPLHLACIHGRVDVIKALIKAGAAVDARATGPKSLRMTPITWCAYGAHDNAVGALLKGGADPNLVVDDEAGNKLTVVGL